MCGYGKCVRARSEIPYGRRLFGVGCLLHNSSVRRCANVLLIFRAGIQAIGSGKDLRMKVRRVMVSGACSHSGNCAPWSGSPYFLRRVRGHGLALPRKRAETGFGVKLPPPPPYLYRSVLGHKSGFVISGISLKTHIICSQPFPVATMTHERKLHFQ